MDFTIRAFTEADAEEIASWRYPAPYDAYDLTEDPPLESEMRESERWGATWFAADDAETGTLAGFLELLASESETAAGMRVEVEVGLGLRPDLTGRGIGASFVEAALEFSSERWQPNAFALDVFPWNERAISCYERVGFQRGEEYVRTFPDGNEVTFLRMARPA
jgi:ribosomal-protein-alanine N-acetyltransferase